MGIYKSMLLQIHKCCIKSQQLVWHAFIDTWQDNEVVSENGYSVSLMDCFFPLVAQISMNSY